MTRTLYLFLLRLAPSFNWKLEGNHIFPTILGTLLLNSALSANQTFTITISERCNFMPNIPIMD